MKVKSIYLQGYKRFSAGKEIRFYDDETGRIQNLKVLVGRNGSGKSTVLQAIASMLGTVTGKIKKPSLLNYPGYNYPTLNSVANITARLVCSFDEEERATTHELHSKVAVQKSNIKGSVGDEPEVTLFLNYLEDKVYAPNLSLLNQFRGRYFAILYRELVKDSWDNFLKVGTTMWYHEQRTSTSLSGENGDVNKAFDIEMLRQRLADYQTFHYAMQESGKLLRKGQRDVYMLLNEYYNNVFQDRRLEGLDTSWRPGFNESPYFFLFDNLGQRRYEVSEMSGGERAIFPMLLDFAAWNINKSVILIDEIELHLHPPLQQALLSTLTTIGQDNQFIITTHSDYVASLFPESSIVRMD